MNWRIATNWLVAQVQVIVIFVVCHAYASDTSKQNRDNYLRRGLGMADSWMRAEESGEKYFNLRLHWEKGYR